MNSIDAIIQTYIARYRDRIMNCPEDTGEYIELMETLRPCVVDPSLEMAWPATYHFTKAAVSLYMCTTRFSPGRMVAEEDIGIISRSYLEPVINDFSLEQTAILAMQRALIIVPGADDRNNVRQKIANIIQFEQLDPGALEGISKEKRYCQILAYPQCRCARANLFLDNLDMLRLQLSDRFNDNTILQQSANSSMLGLLFEMDKPGLN